MKHCKTVSEPLDNKHNHFEAILSVRKKNYSTAVLLTSLWLHKVCKSDCGTWHEKNTNVNFNLHNFCAREKQTLERQKVEVGKINCSGKVLGAKLFITVVRRQSRWEDEAKGLESYLKGKSIPRCCQKGKALKNSFRPLM